MDGCGSLNAGFTDRNIGDVGEFAGQSLLQNHPYEDELDEILKVSQNKKLQHDQPKRAEVDSYGFAKSSTPEVEEDTSESTRGGSNDSSNDTHVVGLSLNADEAANLLRPIDLKIPEREQSSSILVFLEMSTIAIALKFLVCYLLTLLGMDQEDWTTYILMHAVLFPAGICIGFLRLNKSFLAMPDLEKSKPIEWKVSKAAILDGEILKSPPFSSLTITKTFSIIKLLSCRNGDCESTHNCKWRLMIIRNKEHKDEFQLGLMADDLLQVQGIGLNVYFRINGRDMFISYHPFVKQGDFGTTSFLRIPEADDTINVTCQMQCIYFYLQSPAKIASKMRDWK
jgi:hypothetical protein